ncbi:MAG: hypothetical protein H7195_01450 [Chryseobacterium sp.]|nr:hypothetical protein [Chryseobacterium sp.]
MKKLFALLIILGFSAAFYGQNIPVVIEKSELFKDEFKNSVILLSEKNSQGEVTLVRSYNGSMLSQGSGFYIEKYDNNLKLKKAFDFEMKHPGYQKYNTILGVFRMSDNLHFIEIYYDLNEKSYICFDNIISKDFNNTNRELFRLTKEDMKKLGNFSLQQKCFARSNEFWTNDNSGTINSENAQNNTDGFYNAFFGSHSGVVYDYNSIYHTESKNEGSDIMLNVNENKTAFCIAIGTNTGEKDCLKLYLFDNNLNKKMDIFYKNDIIDKKCFFQNIQTSPDGNSILLLAKAYRPNLKKKKEGGKYYYEFSKITSENQVSQKIDVGDHFVGTLKTYFHNNELINIGFYCDADDYKYSGVCAFKLDSNSLELKSSYYSPFTTQFLFDKYGDNKSKSLKGIDFKKVFFTEDNEIIVNAEESYVESNPAPATAVPSSLYGGMSMNSSSVHYNFDDIIIAKLNADGNMIWARNINKKQSTTVDDNSFVSYTSIFNKDKNYFFINTKDEIKTLKDGRIEFGQTRKNKSNLDVIEVDANGNFQYKEILDDEENAVPFMVSKGAIIDNSVYFMGRRGREKQLLKVTL